MGMQRIYMIAAAIVVIGAHIGDAEEPPNPEVANDYYRDQQAREVIDKIIEVYGGQERVEALRRVKIRSKIILLGDERTITIYQTPTAIRRDTEAEGISAVQCFDGETAWARDKGVLMSAPNEVLTALKFEMSKGLPPQTLLRTLLSKDRLLAFRGKTKLNELDAWLFETRNIFDQPEQYYFDAKTHRQLAKITGVPGDTTREHFERYDTFEGVLFATRVALVNKEDKAIGTLEILELSSKFDDSVFNADQNQPKR